MNCLFLMVPLAIKDQLHIKSLQGVSFHLEDSEIANNFDFFKKVNSLDYIFRYRLLPIVPGNYYFCVCLLHIGKLQNIYSLYSRKNWSDSKIRGLQNVLMNMFPLSSVLVHFVGRMIHSFQNWQLKQQQILIFPSQCRVSLLAFLGFESPFVAPFPLTIAPSAGFYNSSPVMGSTQIAEASLQHCTQQDMIHKSVFHPGDSLPDIFFFLWNSPAQGSHKEFRNFKNYLLLINHLFDLFLLIEQG